MDITVECYLPNSDWLISIWGGGATTMPSVIKLPHGVKASAPPRHLYLCRLNSLFDRQTLQQGNLDFMGGSNERLKRFVIFSLFILTMTSVAIAIVSKSEKYWTLLICFLNSWWPVWDTRPWVGMEWLVAWLYQPCVLHFRIHHLSNCRVALLLSCSSFIIFLGRKIEEQFFV